MRKIICFVVFVLCLNGLYAADEANITTTEAVVTSTNVPTESTTQTTHSPTVETTSLPTTVTTSPSETTASSTETTHSSETTHSVTETTTHSSTESTTVSTLAPPTSTGVPMPATGTWNVTDGDVVCIRAEMAIQLKIQFDQNITFNFENTTEVDHHLSSCNYTGNSNEQSMVLVDDGYTLSLIFAKNSGGAFLQNISVAWEKEERHISGAYFSTPNRMSYKCSQAEEIKMDNVTVIFESVRIQTFGEKDDKGFLKEIECRADDKMDNIIPIAVACVLVGMVIIILVGYLIGRRRTRQHGYQSV